MKRFHVHIAVNDIAQSVGFYSTLFGQAPSVQKPDYAKWMLDDPRVNFAISAHGQAVGLDHLGFQVDSSDELQAMTEHLQQAGVAVLDQGAATCCYAQSEKGWVHDPQGIAWESFVTTGQSTTYGADRAVQTDTTCCAPVAATPVATAKTRLSLKDIQIAPAACCAPSATGSSSATSANASCC